MLNIIRLKIISVWMFCLLLFVFQDLIYLLIISLNDLRELTVYACSNKRITSSQLINILSFYENRFIEISANQAKKDLTLMRRYIYSKLSTSQELKPSLVKIELMLKSIE